MIKVTTARCWDLVIFYFKEKCFVLHASASHLRDVYISKAFWRPCRKSNISGYIWHKLLIQTVKSSFFSHIIVDQSFYGALLTISYFLLWGKILCFTLVGKSRCLFPKPSEDLVEEKITPVIFDTNCSFKQ